MNIVELKHLDYLDSLDDWVRVDDVCRGQKVIKEKGKVYLPVPISFGGDDPERYAEYLERAHFYGVTGQTLIRNIGSAFSKLPDFKRPDELEYLERNADGAGRSIFQVSQRMLRQMLKQYRCGVYVDFPLVKASRSRADDKYKNAFPMIHAINALAIEDWDHIVVGNQRRLSYVKIKERFTVRAENGFSCDTVSRYRILRLSEHEGSFIYSVHVHQLNEDGEWYESEGYQPTDYHGKTWAYIPFTFCGAIDNSDEIHNAPLLELAELNLAHYRNSADVEESGFIVGQPTVSLPNVSIEQYELIKRDKLAVGARNGFPTKVEIIQAESNNLATQLMDKKWAQMKEMGARLIESGSANKTATQADNEDSIQHSVVSLAVSNISEALQMALRWCAKFALPDHDLSADELTYVISQDFNKPKYSPERSKLIYEAVQANVLPPSVWFQYEQTGTFTDAKWDDVQLQVDQWLASKPLGGYIPNEAYNE